MSTVIASTQTAHKSANMKPAKPKLQTAQGKLIAPFTMVVEFKPEHQLPNPDTGEIKQRWTYRSDLEALKLERKEGIAFEKPLDVLGFVYYRSSHKFSEVRLYDNRKPQGDDLVMYEVKGKMIIPTEPHRQKQFRNWIKSLAA